MHFIDEKYLTEEEIKIIADWAEGGAPMGDSAAIPPVPDFPKGSELANPDLVIACPPFKIKGDNREKFIMVKVPFELPNDTFIRSIEFVPGNKKLLHHMKGHMIVFDNNKSSKDLYRQPFIIDRDTAYEISESAHNLNLLYDDGTTPLFIGSVANYLPGSSGIIYPENIGGYTAHKRNALLLRDIHYGATTVEQWDSSYFNIFFADKKPLRPTREIQLGTLGISPIVPPLVIPPGKISTYKTNAVVPVDISLLTINPHMHLLGKSFWAYAIAPNGDSIRIVKIPKWDFRWQYNYTYPKPLIIPAGSTIYVEGVFDNTDKNPNNPFFPPRTVREPIGFGDSLLLAPQLDGDLSDLTQLNWYQKDSLICQNCPSIYVSPSVNTVYTLEYTIGASCKKVVSILVRVDRRLVTGIPNVFMPSSTSGNERFYIPQTRGIRKINRLHIFSRWAENVYSITDAAPGISSIGWDGTFAGKEAAQGVYVLLAEFTLADGTIWTYKGDLLLVR